MFGGKYEMRGATDQGDCSLTLYSLDLRIDDGQWQCQVSQRHLREVCLHFSKRQSINLTDVYMLQCNVTNLVGDPN